MLFTFYLCCGTEQKAPQYAVVSPTLDVYFILLIIGKKNVENVSEKVQLKNDFIRRMTVRVENIAATPDYKRVPFCLGQGLPLSQARELLEDVYKNLLKGEAEYRWE